MYVYMLALHSVVYSLALVSSGRKAALHSEKVYTVQYTC